MTTPQTEAFNRPHQTIVAIDTRHIGDDNDYSCFLSQSVYQLYVAGQIDLAYRLYRTDPLLLNDCTVDEFKQRMEEMAAFNTAERESQALYDRFSND